MSGGSLLHAFDAALNEWIKVQATGAGIGISDASITPVGYEQITSLATAASLTVPTGARFAVIQAEAKNIRYRDDGTAPTASVGMLITAGYELVYTGDLSAIRLIETSASAIANISYYA